MAHTSIYMLGAYTTWLFVSVLNSNYFLAMALAAIATAIVGICMERMVFRRLKGMLMPIIIVSIGLMQVLDQSALLVFGVNEKIIPNPFPGVLAILGTIFPVQRLVIMCVGFGLTVFVMICVKKTRLGLALRAVADDRDTAALYGISFNRYGALAFGIGCGLAGIAGALVAPLFYVSPYMGHGPLLKIFILIIVGGLGSLPGTILAGLLLGFIDSFVATLIDPVVAAIVGFVMVIVVLLFRPTGLLGHE